MEFYNEFSEELEIFDKYFTMTVFLANYHSGLDYLSYRKYIIKVKRLEGWKFIYKLIEEYYELEEKNLLLGFMPFGVEKGDINDLRNLFDEVKYAIHKKKIDKFFIVLKKVIVNLNKTNNNETNN